MKASTQAVLIFGGLGFLVYQLRKIIPGIGNVIAQIGGSVGNVVGGIAQEFTVPAGANATAVQYWKNHGLEYSAFMAIARGDQVIPGFLAPFLPVQITAGELFQVYANWSAGTTVGDLERWISFGLPGSSDDFLMNLASYSDATLWRIDELDTIWLGMTDESLHERVIM